MSVVGDNDGGDDAWIVRNFGLSPAKQDPGGNPEDGQLTGLLAVVDWWITMLHVMIALGRTCVFQQVASRASSKWQHEQERSMNRNAAVLSLDRTFTRWRAERCKSDQQHRWGDGRSNTSEQRSGESGVVARWRDGGVITS
ncbi:hypothetical protein NL676_014424 [Syzygium grande]|nr:hypothetical protein NL676_014424 [Syzygium grande]